MPLKVRILAVTDGRLTFDKKDNLGLGYALELAKDSAEYVFDFTFVHLEKSVGLGAIDPRDYDQVWCFGIRKNANKYGKSAQDLVKRISEGPSERTSVFATGDHASLGAALCSRIRAVRFMRNWGEDRLANRFMEPRDYERLAVLENYGIVQPASKENTETRIDTIRTTPYERERFSDTVLEDKLAKFIEPRLFGPHPDQEYHFITRDKQKKPILNLPDHNHEGFVYDWSKEKLHPEDTVPQQKTSNEVSIEDSIKIIEEEFGEAKPEVIADSHTFVGREWSHYRVRQSRAYSVAAVYDPAPTGCRGRAVVCSTFHHWINDHVKPFSKTTSSPELEQWTQMRAFYRNIAEWLVPAKKRIATFEKMIAEECSRSHIVHNTKDIGIDHDRERSSQRNRFIGSILWSALVHKYGESSIEEHLRNYIAQLDAETIAARPQSTPESAKESHSRSHTELISGLTTDASKKINEFKNVLNVINREVVYFHTLGQMADKHLGIEKTLTEMATHETKISDSRDKPVETSGQIIARYIGDDFGTLGIR